MSMREPRPAIPKSIQHIVYRPSRGNSQDVHPLALETETKVIRAEACAIAAEQLKRQGFRPDIICGHPGWGELLFLHHVWPNTPILMYQEFFYRVIGFDYDFDPEFQVHDNWERSARVSMKNANTLLNLEAANWNICPTLFQRSSFPERFHQKISVIHDGVDTSAAQPEKAIQGLKLDLRDGITLKQGEPIITFVNRTLEPYRGYHSFIRAIPYIQQLQPSAKIVIVGAEKGISYGSACPNGEWKEYFLKEIEGNYSPANLYFTGLLNYDQFRILLKISQAHVYLTYPFVLSWSLLEAMSTGCSIIGSRTAPVMEAIHDQKNGLLVDFFNPKEIAEAISLLLRDRKLAKSLGKQARIDAIKNYSIEKCLPRQLELINLVARGALGG